MLHHYLLTTSPAGFWIEGLKECSLWWSKCRTPLQYRMFAKIYPTFTQILLSIVRPCSSFQLFSHFKNRIQHENVLAKFHNDLVIVFLFGGNFLHRNYPECDSAPTDRIVAQVTSLCLATETLTVLMWLRYTPWLSMPKYLGIRVSFHVTKMVRLSNLYIMHCKL